MDKLVLVRGVSKTPLNLTILVLSFISRGFEEGPQMVAGGTSNGGTAKWPSVLIVWMLSYDKSTVKFEKRNEQNHLKLYREIE